MKQSVGKFCSNKTRQLKRLVVVSCKLNSSVLSLFEMFNIRIYRELMNEWFFCLQCEQSKLFVFVDAAVLQLSGRRGSKLYKHKLNWNRWEPCLRCGPGIVHSVLQTYRKLYTMYKQHLLLPTNKAIGNELLYCFYCGKNTRDTQIKYKAKQSTYKIQFED